MANRRDINARTWQIGRNQEVLHETASELQIMRMTVTAEEMQKTETVEKI